MTAAAEIELAGYRKPGEAVTWQRARYRGIIVKALPGESREALLRRLVFTVHAQTGEGIAI